MSKLTMEEMGNCTQLKRKDMQRDGKVSENMTVLRSCFTGNF